MRCYAPVHVSGQVIGTVKCADGPFFLVVGGTVTHVITDGLAETGR